MKTLKLLEHYMSLLEQDAGEVEETDVEVDVDVEDPEPPPGLQSIAELIAAAFAYPPTEENSEKIRERELALLGTHNEAPPIKNIKPRSVIVSVVNSLPKALQDVFVKGPGFSGEGLTIKDEIYFAQILADAYRYRPTQQDLLMVNTITKELENEDPMQVIETVQRLLQFSNEPVKDELENI